MPLPRRRRPSPLLSALLLGAACAAHGDNRPHRAESAAGWLQQVCSHPVSQLVLCVRQHAAQPHTALLLPYCELRARRVHHDCLYTPMYHQNGRGGPLVHSGSTFADELDEQKHLEVGEGCSRDAVRERDPRSDPEHKP